MPGPHRGLRALSLAAMGSGWLLVVEAVIFRDFVCFWCHLNINQNNKLPKPGGSWIEWSSKLSFVSDRGLVVSAVPDVGSRIQPAALSH